MANPKIPPQSIEAEQSVLGAILIDKDAMGLISSFLHPEITKIHPFSLQCQLFGYGHKLIPPAYPKANSHVERTIRTDVEEVYRGRSFTSLTDLHKLTLKSLKYFNEQRPQKSKHFLPPLKFAILNFQLTSQKLNYTVLNVCN